MNYRLEWISGISVFGTVLLLLIIPEFAMIAVLVVALAAFVLLVALAAAALASPFLLVRSLRRRLARPQPRSSAIPAARSLRRQTGCRQRVLPSAEVHRGAAEEPQT
jgi:membrane protein implicated in regulation of membrane protease activity